MNLPSHRLCSLVAAIAASLTASAQDLPPSLLRWSGTEEQCRETGTAIAHGVPDPRLLRPLFASADRGLRLRAAILLRRALGLPIPFAWHEAIAVDPAAPWMGDAVVVRWSDATMKRCIDAAEAGKPSDLAWNVRDNGTPEQRRRLAAALCVVIWNGPTDANERSPGAWARQIQIAAQLDPRALLQLLEKARDGSDMSRVRAAVEGVESAVQPVKGMPGALAAMSMPSEVALAMAPLVENLLASPDAWVRLAAARLAARIVAIVEAPALAATVSQQAVALLGGQALRDATHVRPSSCPDGPVVRSPVVDPAAAIVVAAACAGELALLPPMLAKVRAPVAALGDARDHGRRGFAWHCLARLARHVDADTAAQLWDLVRDPKLGASLDPDDWQPLLCGLLQRLPVARLPEVLFDRVFLEHFDWHGLETVEPGRRREVLRLTDGRVARLIPAYRFERGLLRSLLAAADARRALDIVRGFHDERWVAEQVALGVVPVAPFLRDRRAIAENVILFLPPSIHDGRTQDDSNWFRRLRSMPALERERSNWELLANADDPQLAGVACCRLLELGDDGRAAAERAVKRGIADERMARRAAGMWIATKLGLQVPDHAVVRAEVLACTESAVQPYGFAVRVLDMELPLAAVPSPFVVEVAALVGVPIGKHQLEQWCGAVREQDLFRLLASDAVAVVERALQIAAQVDEWSDPLARMVTWNATDPEPRVRAAAYRALATRDSELVPAALLVHEAEFDADAAVRAVAPLVPK